MKKSILLFFALLFSWNIFAYTSLDKQNPIQFLGNKIIYNNEEIILSENNIFLDGNLSDAEINGKPFVFNDFAKAIKALSETNDKKTIHIAPFVYWIDNPDDTAIRVPDPDDTKKYGRARPYGMTIENHHLHLRGLTENPENVVLASNRGQTQGADGN
ncbi:MAG: hypothetical protein LBR75_02825, partial [Prevotellaceae bacterium]|nr:hypothetical protein [Prevotellaceae bacterium]